MNNNKNTIKRLNGQEENARILDLHLARKFHTNKADSAT